jgi:hypothetical protein
MEDIVMKRITYVLAILTLLGMVILGCEKAQSPMELSPQVDAGSDQLNKAETYTKQYKVDVNFTIAVPCANGGLGEPVQVSGRIHQVIHRTDDGNGGFHFTNKINRQNMKGVGLITGDEYVVNGTWREWMNAQNFKPGKVYTYVRNYHFICKGSGANFILYSHWHYTVNANGDLTIELWKSVAECR